MTKGGIVTVRRLLLTTLGMVVIAAALRGLTGPWTSLLATLSDAPAISGAGAPERVVLAVAGLLAWAIWAWGALGLVLTAAAALPGACGRLARGVTRVVLPASLRTAFGVTLGVGLIVSAPVAAAASVPTAVGVPDWPASPGQESAAPGTPAPPDWPSESASQTAGPHVVAPGDCLWRIAADRLLAGGRHPTDADVAGAVDRWWSANAAVIGPDPDLIRPGQVLRPPSEPAPSTTSDLRPGSTR